MSDRRGRLRRWAHDCRVRPREALRRAPDRPRSVNVRHARRRLPLAVGPPRRRGARRRPGRAGRGRARAHLRWPGPPGGCAGGRPRGGLGCDPRRDGAPGRGAAGQAGRGGTLRGRRVGGCRGDGAGLEPGALRAGGRRLPRRRGPRAGRHAPGGRGRRSRPPTSRCSIASRAASTPPSRSPGATPWGSGRRPSSGRRIGAICSTSSPGPRAGGWSPSHRPSGESSPG
jgi:hypothetical protein